MVGWFWLFYVPYLLKSPELVKVRKENLPLIFPSPTVTPPPLHIHPLRTPAINRLQLESIIPPRWPRRTTHVVPNTDANTTLFEIDWESVGRTDTGGGFGFLVSPTAVEPDGYAAG